MKLEKKDRILFIIISTIVVIAAYFRIVGLSNGGFANSDEYYIAKSVKNILKYGLPQYPLEGYYTRGIIYQYLSALLLLFGIKAEFALRIIPVVFNLAAVPALFLLSKKIVNKELGLAVIVLFCFSILEIEYSRLARYYTPFQTLFLWYVYFFYTIVIEKKQKNYKWLYTLSILGFLMYEGGIFLVVLNFIPFLLSSKTELNLGNIFASTVLFLIAFFYLSFDFRNFGAIDYLPANFQSKYENSLPIIFPRLFILTFNETYWYLVFIISLTITLTVSYITYKKIGFKRIVLLYLLVEFLSLLNLFGLVVISFLLFILLGWIKFEDLKNKYFAFFVGILLFNFLFYFIYGINSDSWIKFFPEESSISINKIFWVLINYPNFYEKIILPWLLPLPKLILIILFTFGIYLLLISINFIKNNIDKYYNSNIILSVIIFLISIVAVLQTPYNDIRYTFFIYPLLLLFMLVSVYFISEYFLNSNKIKLFLLFAFVTLFVSLSSDYNYAHLLNIDSNKIRFRTEYKPAIENIYYFQEDYAAPAEAINKNLKNNDIVITTQETMDYYLNRLDYFYKSVDDMEFTIRSRKNGKKEIWTNANLLSNENDLLNILRNSKSTIWISVFTNKRPGVQPIEETISNEFSNYLYYTNFDSTINVYKITPH